MPAREAEAAEAPEPGAQDAGQEPSPAAEAAASPRAARGPRAVEEAAYDYAYETGQDFETPVEAAGVDLEVRGVLENGIRDISGEVRNSLDFHRSQDGGGDVSHVVLSGAAEGIPGFAEGLQIALGVDVRPMSVGVVDGRLGQGVSPHRLAVAAGLAAAEAPQ